MYQRLKTAARMANISGIVMNGILSRTILTLNDNDLPNFYFAKKGRVLWFHVPYRCCEKLSSAQTNDSNCESSDIAVIIEYI